MRDKLLTPKKLDSIVELARLAPSVHNTQPWKVSVEDDAILVRIDSAHTLADGDPTGRQTHISLGIFAEAVKIAAETAGLRVGRVLFSEGSAKISLRGQAHIAKGDEAELLKTRASDRSIYQPIKLAQKDAKSIKNSWKSRNVRIWVVDDPDFINRLAAFTAQGIRLALSNPSFRQELGHYLVSSWSKKTRGISVKSLYLPPLLSTIEPLMMRLGIGLKQEADLENRRWQSASAVVLITSKGDLHEDWFEVGRAYLRISLAIERLGLSQATSAATVEASTFHEDIEEFLGTKQRLQSSLRIGKGKKERNYSPRVEAKTLIT